MDMCERKETPLGPLLGHCAHLARKRLDARLTQYDVTPAQTHVLLYLQRHGGQAPQCELTEHLKVKPSTANGILDRMVEKGLVERTVHGEDARRRQIILTDQGKSRQETFRQKFEEMEALIVKGLSEAEVQQLHSLLHRIMSNLEEDRSL